MLVDGKLFCRPVRYFRKLEIGRGDQGEGTVFPGICIYTHNDNLVYCMFDTGNLNNNYVLIPKQNIADFSIKFIVVIDYDAFDNALYGNFKNNEFEVIAGNVQYGTPSKELQNEIFCNNSIDNIFIKRPYFAYQKEYRVYCAQSVKDKDFKVLELNIDIREHCRIIAVEKLIDFDELNFKLNL